MVAGVVANVLADIRPNTALPTAVCQGRFDLVLVVKAVFKAPSFMPTRNAQKSRC
jgi:hypothetical protein